MQTSESAIEVLIVGAGPSGLVLACDLLRRGIRVRIIEAEPSAPEDSWGARGKGIQPRTMEIYDDLGIVDRVYEAGSSFFPAMLWNRRTMLGEGRLPRVEPRRPTMEVPHSSTWMVTQPIAIRLLTQLLEQLGGVVEYGTRATSFTQDDQGIDLVVETGGGQSVIRAQYLVGGDGARGIVRAGSGVEFVTSSIDPQPMLAADVMVEGLSRTHWHQWNEDERGSLWLAPLPNSEYFQLYARFESGEPETTAQAVKDLVFERTGFTATSVRQASSFGIRLGMAARFVIDRVILMGDAAHVHPPAGAQGMNTSVQDAYNLGWKLGAVLRHGAPVELLETYEGERIPVAANLLTFVGEVYAKWIGRNQEYTEADERGDNLQLSLNYGSGPLAVPGGGSPTLASGDRVPDAALRTGDGSSLRLFDLLRGPHFTLLAVGSTAIPEWSGPAIDKGVVRAFRLVRSGQLDAAPNDIRDPYGFPSVEFGPGLTLIRPDGYLALAGASSEDVQKYLTRWLGSSLLRAREMA